MLGCLGVNYHDVYNLPSNGSAKKVYTHREDNKSMAKY